ncbi:MAG: glycosyltransferase family 4 protein [Pseudomonadota bacterium]
MTIKIAYLCDRSPDESWSYSGGNSRILRELQTHVGDVTILNSGWHSADIVRRLIDQLPQQISARARWRMQLFLSKIISRGVAQELRADKFDVLFCPYSFHSLANLDLPYPMVSVHTSDATPTTYKRSEVGQSFGSYLSLSRLLDPSILKSEKKVFQATDLLLWPSRWLKESADELYELDDKASFVVPWGANIEAPSRDELQIDEPIRGRLELLLVGRDWFAKGGPLAFEILQLLLGQGVPAHLTVIGCTPPEAHQCKEMTIHGHLDKSQPKDLATFTQAFQKSHFLLMPSLESYGFVFAEASAYALPALGLRVGGVPIKEGVNGHAFALGTPPEHYANILMRYMQKPQAYLALRRSARAYFETDLNWTAWGRRVRSLLEQRLQTKAQKREQSGQPRMLQPV